MVGFIVCVGSKEWFTILYNIRNHEQFRVHRFRDCSYVGFMGK
jgi:hypothetical protein